MIVTSPNTLRDLTRNNPAQLKLGVTSTMILWGMKVTQFASQPENYPMSSVSNFRKRTLSVDFLSKGKQAAEQSERFVKYLHPPRLA